MIVKNAVIVTAAGSSQRFKIDVENSTCHAYKKEFVLLNGHSVLYAATMPFFLRKDTVAVFVTYKTKFKEQTKRAIFDFVSEGTSYCENASFDEFAKKAQADEIREFNAVAKSDDFVDAQPEKGEFCKPDVINGCISKNEFCKPDIMNKCFKPDGFVNNIPIYFVQGGGTRRESVFNALKTMEKIGLFPADKTDKNTIDLVTIHDGARPFVTQKIIDDCLCAAAEYGAAVPAIPLTDTPVFVNSENCVQAYPDRNKIFRVQTPQVFKYSEILKAHKVAAQNSERFGKEYTDDSSIFFAIGGKVKIVEGCEKNRKITYKTDLRKTI